MKGLKYSRLKVNVIMYTSSFLTEVRRKALRRGVWYGALDRVERGILSLAAQVVDRVESARARLGWIM